MKQATLTSPVDNILVDKSNRKMHLRHGDKIVKTYKISLGKDPVGAKVKSGDNKTPEGQYSIVKHNPKSAYHLSLKISYPNEEQIKAAKDGGYDPGGDIMIHGYPNKASFLFRFKHRWKDWTAGCIAVTNDEIEEIYDAVKDGTPITIVPKSSINHSRPNENQHICDVMQNIINQLKEKNIPLAESRMRDYHFHEFYFRVNANPEVIKLLKFEGAHVVKNSVICDCHWSEMEFKEDNNDD